MDDATRIELFLMGLGFGTAVGLLLAPKAGSDTRNDLRSQSREAAERLKFRGQSLYKRAKKGVQDVQRQAEDQVKHFSHAADAVMLAFRKALNET